MKTALIDEVNNIRGAFDIVTLRRWNREISGLSRLFEEAKRRAMDLQPAPR